MANRFVCPKTIHAIKLNIAADLVTQFKVSPEDLNQKTQEVFSWISDNNPSFIDKVEEEISQLLADQGKTIKKNAVSSMDKKYAVDDIKTVPLSDIKKAFISVETERMRKK